MLLPKDFKEFIALLNAHDVKYVVVGGYAVAFHGFPRMTGDLDVFVDISQENARAVVAVVREFGFAELGLHEKEFEQADQFFQLGHVPLRIDIATGIDGVSFADAWGSHLDATVDGVLVHFIGKDELVRNKSATGRQRDLSDVEELTRDP